MVAASVSKGGASSENSSLQECICWTAHSGLRK